MNKDWPLKATDHKDHTLNYFDPSIKKYRRAVSISEEAYEYAAQAIKERDELNSDLALAHGMIEAQRKELADMKAELLAHRIRPTKGDLQLELDELKAKLDRGMRVVYYKHPTNKMVNFEAYMPVRLKDANATIIVDKDKL